MKLIVAFCDFANAPNYIIRRNSTRSYLSFITTYWAYSSATTVTPHMLGCDNSIINFVHSIIFQKPQLISYEHLHVPFVPSINNSQPVTTDRLSRKCWPEKWNLTEELTANLRLRNSPGVEMRGMMTEVRIPSTPTENAALTYTLVPAYFGFIL
jgi:hypothetical protein